jgi:hypothetical protein
MHNFRYPPMWQRYHNVTTLMLCVLWQVIGHSEDGLVTVMYLDEDGAELEAHHDLDCERWKLASAADGEHQARMDEMMATERSELDTRTALANQLFLKPNSYWATVRIKAVREFCRTLQVHNVIGGWGTKKEIIKDLREYIAALLQKVE